MRNRRNRKRIEKLKKWVVVLYVLVALTGITYFYAVTKDRAVLIFVSILIAVLSVFAWLIHFLEDQYVSSIVSDLSELTDMLLFVRKEEIFPENEDTLVSKLQAKVIKLADVLQKKERKSKEEQENIKSLVSDLSHQLKTPIANLKMYSAFLRDNTLEQEKREQYVQILQMSVERLYFLSESMIKISRLESGLIHLHPELQSLNGTVLQAVKQVYVAAKEKQVEMEYEEEAELLIDHDRNWTAEAVYNLLDNAVKYAKEESCIKLSLRSLGMYTVITVEDQNDPIPEAEQSQVFMRFFRGSNSRKKEGVGVGLYLAREIAMQQGGYMKLQARGTGNSFSIFLPKKGSFRSEK